MFVSKRSGKEVEMQNGLEIINEVKHSVLPDINHCHFLSQIFLGALSFVYFAKALSGSYLKSTITQIERRFDIPSSLVGVIDGSFEIGMCCINPFLFSGKRKKTNSDEICHELYESPRTTEQGSPENYMTVNTITLDRIGLLT